MNETKKKKYSKETCRLFCLNLLCFLIYTLALTPTQLSTRNLVASANDPASVPLIVTISNVTISGFGAGAVSLVGNIQASFVNVKFKSNGQDAAQVYGGAIHINGAYDGTSNSTSGI